MIQSFALLDFRMQLIAQHFHIFTTSMSYDFFSLQWLLVLDVPCSAFNTKYGSYEFSILRIALFIFLDVGLLRGQCEQFVRGRADNAIPDSK